MEISDFAREFGPEYLFYMGGAALDIASTYFAMRSGNGREANNAVRKTIEEQGLVRGLVTEGMFSSILRTVGYSAACAIDMAVPSETELHSLMGIIGGGAHLNAAAGNMLTAFGMNKLAHIVHTPVRTGTKIYNAICKSVTGKKAYDY